MKVIELLKELRRLGVEATPDGEKLRLKGPVKRLSAEIKALIADRKQEILSILAQGKAQRADDRTITGVPRPFDPMRVDRVNSLIWESGERLNAAFPDGAEGFHERLRVSNPPAWSEVDRAWTRVGDAATEFLRDASVTDTVLIEATRLYEQACLDARAEFAGF
ncbi:MAG: hypothetical protein HYY84_12315, partial [Deltaproteobacteria bacterium]|nr:hypothetical protein [Deltaproteobacteria bacterium]